MRRLVPAAGIVGTILWATACQPAPPVPGRTLIVGDSVTWQVEQIDGDSLDRADWLDAPGVDAGFAFIRDGVQQRAQDSKRSPDVVVYALGLNDAALPGGWTESDRRATSEVLDMLHPDTCLVLVLPGVGAAVDPAYRAELNEARSFFLSVQVLRRAQGRRVAAVDWQPAVNADPPLLRADGVHLRDDPTGAERSDPSAARVRRNLYAQGVARC